MRRIIWSLQTQFLVLILGITLALILVLGFLNLQTVNGTSTRIAAMSLNWQAQRTSAPIQGVLTSTMDMTDILANGLIKDVPDPGRLSDPAFRKGILVHLQKHFNLSAKNSTTVFGYYVQFNPELTGGPAGFWYTWDPRRSQYISHSREAMGAYFYGKGGFLPYFRDLIADGKPVWRNPYDDHNFGVRRISYIVPVYSNGTFVAFLGMSIRMDTLVTMMSHASIYDTGYATLFSDGGEIFYHPDYPEGASTTLKDFGLEPYADLLKGRDSNTDLFTYYYKGEKKEMAFITLKNGMNLGIVAPDSEIYKERKTTYGRLLFLTILFGLFTSGLAIITANRIIAPLKDIDAAAKRMGQGDYDTFIHNNRGDEVGELAQNMNQTMVLMKDMFARLEKQAMEDTLTRVKNNRAYEQMVHELNHRMYQEPKPAFGVLMVDVNGLKGVNDRFGHEQGNLLLKHTVKTICDLFKHSPVYRVGGDEFVVILQNQDYTNRKALLEQLRPYSRKRDYSLKEPWLQLAFASGFSNYDPETDENYLQVFFRADAAMYLDKKSREGKEMR